MKALPLFAVLLLALVSGCSRGSSGSIVGKWKVDPSLSGANASPEDKGFVIGFGSTFHFEFKSDKTFVGAITEGTYTLDGSKLSMKTTKVLGQDVSKASTAAGAEKMTGELSSDGKTLTLHPNFVNVMPASMSGGVRMVRDSGGEEMRR